MRYIVRPANCQPGLDETVDLETGERFDPEECDRLNDEWDNACKAKELLAKTDYKVLVDVVEKLTKKEKIEIFAYREKLREVVRDGSIRLPNPLK